MFVTRNIISLCKNFNISCCKTTILSHQNAKINIKKFSSSMPFIPRSRPLKESKYLQKDRIPNGFRIIYKAPMEHFLMAGKNVTTITFCLISATIIYKLSKGVDILNIPLQDDLGGLILGGSDLIYFATGFLLIAIAVRLIIQCYPLRIYRNRNSYIAIFQGQIPFKNQRLYFERGDVSEYSSIFLNPWRDSMYKIGNKKALLLVHYFKTPSELTDMIIKDKTEKN